MVLNEEKSGSQNTLSTHKYLPKFVGRLSRGQYLICMVILWLSAFLIVLLQEASELTAVFSLPLSIIFTVLLFSVFVRRLHDLNQSGWVSIGFLLPFVNAVLAVYTFFWSGKEDKNRFGSRLPEKTKVIAYFFGE